jgi:hypothetical protein
MVKVSSKSGLSVEGKGGAFLGSRALADRRLFLSRPSPSSSPPLSSSLFFNKLAAVPLRDIGLSTPSFSAL